MVGISALTLAAGGPAAGLYEIPGLSAFRSLAEGMANRPEGDQGDQVIAVQPADQSEGDQILAVQTDEDRYASQEESEKGQTPSEPQGEAENSEKPALDSGSSVPELASVEPPPETQYVAKPIANPFLPSTQPKAKSSRESDTSTSSTLPTRTGETKGDSSSTKNTAEQSQPRSLRPDSSKSTFGTSAQLTDFSKDEADNREEAQEEREEAREQSVEQAEEAAEEREEAREEAKERLKKRDRPDR